MENQGWPTKKQEITLLRTISAELHAFSFSCRLLKIWFGKSYYSLGLEEKAAVHETVGRHIFDLIQLMGSWKIPKVFCSNSIWQRGQSPVVSFHGILSYLTCYTTGKERICHEGEG